MVYRRTIYIWYYCIYEWNCHETRGIVTSKRISKATPWNWAV